jgi:hypothetical protein
MPRIDAPPGLASRPSPEYSSGEVPRGLSNGRRSVLEVIPAAARFSLLAVTNGSKKCQVLSAPRGPQKRPVESPVKSTGIRLSGPADRTRQLGVQPTSEGRKARNSQIARIWLRRCET